MKKVLLLTTGAQFPRGGERRDWITFLMQCWDGLGRERLGVRFGRELRMPLAFVYLYATMLNIPIPENGHHQTGCLPGHSGFTFEWKFYDGEVETLEIKGLRVTKDELQTLLSTMSEAGFDPTRDLQFEFIEATPGW